MRKSRQKNYVGRRRQSAPRRARKPRRFFACQQKKQVLEKRRGRPEHAQRKPRGYTRHSSIRTKPPKKRLRQLPESIAEQMPRLCFLKSGNKNWRPTKIFRRSWALKRMISLVSALHSNITCTYSGEKEREIAHEYEKIEEAVSMQNAKTQRVNEERSVLREREQLLKEENKDNENIISSLKALLASKEHEQPKVLPDISELSIRDDTMFTQDSEYAQTETQVSIFNSMFIVVSCQSLMTLNRRQIIRLVKSVAVRSRTLKRISRYPVEDAVTDARLPITGLAKKCRTGQRKITVACVSRAWVKDVIRQRVVCHHPRSGKLLF